MTDESRHGGSSAVEALTGGRGSLAVRLLLLGGFVLCVLFCIAWTLLQAYLLDRVTIRLCATQDRVLQVGKNPLPVNLLHGAYDGYLWNEHATSLGRNGALRLRWTDFDNAMEGRPVHWSSGYTWYLHALGSVLAAKTGEPLRNATFRMSLWADPLLMVAGILVLGSLGAWWFGPVPGIFLVLGMVAMPSYSGAFLPGNPDHHSLVSLALLAYFLGLARACAGWVGMEAGDRRRRQAGAGMMLSGIAGGVGFWVSSLSMCLALLATGIGVLTACALMRWRPAGKDDEAAVFQPQLWRLWALTGMFTCIGFYALEYFPNHLGMRLEVNHPFYALAWAGGGFALAALGGWIAGTAPSRGVFPWREMLVSASLCLPLSAALFFFRSYTFQASDPFLLRFWSHTVELQPLLAMLADGSMNFFGVLGFGPVLAPIALAVALLSSIHAVQRPALATLAVSAIVLVGFQLWQLRWGLLTGSAYVVLAALLARLVVQQFKTARPWRKAGTLLAGIVVFPALLVPAAMTQLSGLLKQYQDGGRARIDQGQALGLLHRHIATEMVRNANPEDIVLLSSPNTSVMLASLSGSRTLGTAYWENRKGLKAAAQVFSETNESKVRDMLFKHGITHISLIHCPNYLAEFRQTLGGELDKPDASIGFGERLMEGTHLPKFVRRVEFPQSIYASGLGQTVRYYEVDTGKFDESSSAGE